MIVCYFCVYMGEQYVVFMVIWEQLFYQCFVGYCFDFLVIVWCVEVFWFLQVDQLVGLFGFGQVLCGVVYLFELVVVVGDQQQWIGVVVFFDQDCVVVGQVFGLDGVEYYWLVVFGDYQVGQLFLVVVDCWQQCQGVVVIGWEEYLDYVVYFVKQGFVEGGVLV